MCFSLAQKQLFCQMFRMCLKLSETMWNCLEMHSVAFLIIPGPDKLKKSCLREIPKTWKKCVFLWLKNSLLSNVPNLPDTVWNCVKLCRYTLWLHFWSFQAQTSWKKLVSEKSQKLRENVFFSGWKTAFLSNIMNVPETVWNCVKLFRNAFVMYFWSFQAQISWEKLVSEKSQKLGENVFFSGWKTAFLSKIPNVPETVWNSIEMHLWCIFYHSRPRSIEKILFERNKKKLGKYVFFSAEKQLFCQMFPICLKLCETV